MSSPFLEWLIRKRLAWAHAVRLLPARQLEAGRHDLLMLPRKLRLGFLYRLQDSTGSVHQLTKPEDLRLGSVLAKQTSQ